GFVLGALNALVIGATLSLIEQAVTSSRSLGWHDIRGSVGQYFWDVIGVGFVLWVPMLLLEQGMAANPNGPFFAAAIFLLLFILLNPAPERIDRKSTRLNSSYDQISYAVFCLKKKNYTYLEDGRQYDGGLAAPVGTL